MIKLPTGCCALAQIKCGDETTIQELQYTIEKLKRESQLFSFLGTGADFGGQKAVFIITVPSEKQLEKTLKACGFKHTFTFNRRKGYPAGKLKHWMLGWD